MGRSFGMLISMISLYLLFFGTSFLFVYRFKKIFEKKLNKYLCISIPIIIILFIFVIRKFDIVECDIVFGHLTIIWFILYLLIYKLSKKKIGLIVVDISSIILATIYIFMGYYNATHIVAKKFVFDTNKDISDLRIIQLTDNHIGSTMDGIKFSKYMDEINEYNPDLVVITGDFVDDDTKYKELVDACNGLSKLNAKYGVYYVFGNHDKAYFNLRDFKEEDLRRELIKSNVKILEDEVVEITDNIILIGRQDKSEENRKSILELSDDISKDNYIIVLDHQPNDFENEAKSQADLVLTGHTHNGQIFPLNLIIDTAKMFDRTYGYEKRDNTNFIVSSGMGGWRVPFKSAGKSEYSVIDIKKDSN